MFLSLSETGPWQQVLEEALEDSRNQNDPLPLMTFEFNSVTARYVKFKILEWWGTMGGGLQYFKIKKSTTTTTAATTTAATTTAATTTAATTAAATTTPKGSGVTASLFKKKTISQADWDSFVTDESMSSEK